MIDLGGPHKSVYTFVWSLLLSHLKRVGQNLLTFENPFDERPFAGVAFFVSGNLANQFSALKICSIERSEKFYLIIPIFDVESVDNNCNLTQKTFANRVL